MTGTSTLGDLSIEKVAYWRLHEEEGVWWAVSDDVSGASVLDATYDGCVKRITALMGDLYRTFLWMTVPDPEP